MQVISVGGYKLRMQSISRNRIKKIIKLLKKGVHFLRKILQTINKIQNLISYLFQFNSFT